MSLREQLSRCIIENQSEDGSIDISDQKAMLDELIDVMIAALPDNTLPSDFQNYNGEPRGIIMGKHATISMIKDIFVKAKEPLND